MIGIIKNAIKDAILDGEIPNEYEAAYELMLEEGAALGLSPQEGTKDKRARDKDQGGNRQNEKGEFQEG